MNNYIILDSKWYKAVQGKWEPIKDKPATDRILVEGGTDVAYGPIVVDGWQGDLIAPVTASGSWGTYANLKTTVDKLTTVSFTEFDGTTTYNVHILGPIKFRPAIAVWDSPNNEWYVTLRLLKHVTIP